MQKEFSLFSQVPDGEIMNLSAPKWGNGKGPGLDQEASGWRRDGAGWA